MITVIEKFRTPTHFLASNIGCAIYQLVVLGILMLAEGFVGLFLGHFFGTIDQRNSVGNAVFPLTIFAIFLSGCYAILWLLFWAVLNTPNGNVKWFYWKVTFSTLPFLIAFAMFDPHPNPMAMIPTSHAEYQFVFSCLVTGFLMYPIYSIALYKYVLQRSSRKFINFLGICAVILPIGTVIFILCWNSMDLIYHLP